MKQFVKGPVIWGLGGLGVGVLPTIADVHAGRKKRMAKKQLDFLDTRYNQLLMAREAYKSFDRSAKYNDQMNAIMDTQAAVLRWKQHNGFLKLILSVPQIPYDIGYLDEDIRFYEKVYDQKLEEARKRKKPLLPGFF